MIESLKIAIQYYLRVYKRFGHRAVLFLLRSKFNGRKTDRIKIRGIKHSVFLSNFKCDVTILFQIFFAGEYDIKMNRIPEGIIDCGANIGLSAVYFANKFPGARIIAIEPDKENFKFLKLNAKPYPNVVCLQKAIWPHSQKLEIVDSGRGNWGLQTKEASGNSEHIIEGVTLDEIMAEYNFDTIGLLKIDIEGAEKELFMSGYENWLSKTNVMAIELHDFFDDTISPVFYKAIEPYNFKQYGLGENLICVKDSVNV